MVSLLLFAVFAFVVVDLLTEAALDFGALGFAVLALFTTAFLAGLAGDFVLLFLEDCLELGLLAVLVFSTFFVDLPLGVFVVFFVDLALVVDLVLAGCLDDFLAGVLGVLAFDVALEAGFLAGAVVFLPADAFRLVAGLEVDALRIVLAGAFLDF